VRHSSWCRIKYINSLLAFARREGRTSPMFGFSSCRHISRIKIKFHCRGPRPPPRHVLARWPVLRVALRIVRLVLCQTRARRAKDRSLQAGIGVHLLPAQEARATLALWVYITRKRPIRELSCFDLSANACTACPAVNRIAFPGCASFSSHVLADLRIFPRVISRNGHETDR